jgi:hypothetical protein
MSDVKNLNVSTGYGQAVFWSGPVTGCKPRLLPN